MYTIISSSIEVTLTSSFPIYILLIFLCCLIALSKTRTVLNRHRESGQPCLFPDFSGIVLSFSPFKLMLDPPSLCPVSLGMLCTDFH